jgi:hypothetical protein
MSNATLPPSLDTLLRADSALGQQLRSVSKAPQRGLTLPSLPAALAAKTRAEVVAGELILIAETSAVAQMLRFHAPKLAREAGLPGFSVRIQAIPAPLVRASSLAAPEFDPGAAAVISEAARLCDYQPLADALTRLAALATEAGPPSNRKS